MNSGNFSKNRTKIAAVISGFLFILNTSSWSIDTQAKITRINGRVEIIRAKSLKWTMAKKGDHLYHNDKIMVHDRARVQGEFADGSHFTLHEKSKVLFNTSRASEAGKAHKIFTIYSGAMYVNIKKPFENYEGHYTKVFLGPLSVVTHEGALVLEQGTEKTGPRVGILAGTSHVFNSNGPQERFYQDGREIMLDTAGTLMEPNEIDVEFYSRRVPWVGFSVLERDLARGKLLRKRNMDIISGKRLGRVVISEFNFEGEGLDKWQVGRFFSTLVAREFSDVSYREIFMIGKSEKEPGQLAREFEADRIVEGSVEKLEFKKKAVLNDDSTKYVLKLEVAFGLKVKIYDRDGRRIIKNAVFNGSLVGKKEEAGNLSEYLNNPLDENNKIMGATTFLKIIKSLKKKLRKFAQSAV